ncbi:hypothetical protein [Caballeronia sp. KNU42]
MLSAILPAEKKSFYVELETREAGVAELVTSNGRERRTFREPGAALNVVREVGLVTCRFALDEWDTHPPKAKAWSRPDQSADMKARHQRAEHAAAFETDILQALEDADDPRVEKISHGGAMARLDAKAAEIQK